jgi:hypothetical protein
MFDIDKEGIRILTADEIEAVGGASDDANKPSTSLTTLTVTTVTTGSSPVCTATTTTTTTSTTTAPWTHPWTQADGTDGV